MTSTLISFMLLLFTELIFAIASYLKNRLMRHMHQRENEQSHNFGYDPDSEFA
jgi:hypothetical protein